MRKLYTILVAVLLTATTLNAKTAESITGTISEIDPIYTGSQAAYIIILKSEKDSAQKKQIN